MNFGQRALMTLRFSGLEVCCGLIIAATGAFGLMTYTPIPDDSPFESPIPFTAIYGLSIFLGLGFVAWSHIKANRN